MNIPPEKRPLFTVLTPAFNRARLLPRVSASLDGQTCQDFEWLVVDDGSSDGTGRVVEALAREAAFPVVYLDQANQGKHVAVNRGVARARGELVCILDSDDALLPWALERLREEWLAIPEAERPGFAGIAGRCVDQEGKVVGPPLPAPVLDSDNVAIKRKYKHTWEKWGCVRRTILAAYPFPEPPGVRFVPEDVVWSAIGRKYRTRFIEAPLRVYFGDAGDQLTKASVSAAQAPGMALWHQALLNQELAWFWSDPASFLRSALHYARFSHRAGQGLGEQWRGLAGWGQRGLWLLGLAPGRLLAWWDRRRGE